MINDVSKSIIRSILSLSDEERVRVMARLSPDEQGYLDRILEKVTDEELQELLQTKAGE